MYNPKRVVITCFIRNKMTYTFMIYTNFRYHLQCCTYETPEEDIKYLVRITNYFFFADKVIFDKFAKF